MIAYLADIEMEVASLKAIEEQVNTIVQRANGYVGYSPKTDQGYTATVKVKPQELEATLDGIAKRAG